MFPLARLEQERGEEPLCLVYDVPASDRCALGRGSVVINPGELLAVPVVVWSLPQVLKDSTIIWFLDNTSAETAMIKSASPTETMCRLAMVAGAALAGLGAKTWFDHVASADNPADVLSRAGFSDKQVAEAVRTRRVDVIEPKEPPWGNELDYEFWWNRGTDLQ